MLYRIANQRGKNLVINYMTLERALFLAVHLELAIACWIWTVFHRSEAPYLHFSEGCFVPVLRSATAAFDSNSGGYSFAETFLLRRQMSPIFVEDSPQPGT